MAATSQSHSPAVAPHRYRSLPGLLCMVVAGLPILASEFGLIPVYDSQRRILPAFAVFFCFLAFAYVFSLRHGLAWNMFDAYGHPRRMSVNRLVASIILASLGAAAAYVWAFESGRGLPTFPELPRTSAEAVILAVTYVGMFLLAEFAFAIIAVREYLQDVLGLSDVEVIHGAASFPEDPITRTQPALSISYRILPPDTADDGELAQFDSEQEVRALTEGESPAAASEGDVEAKAGVPR